MERGYTYGPRMESMVGGSGFQDFHGGGFLEPRAGGKWPERSCVDGWLLPWFLIQGNPRGSWPKVSRDRGDKRATGVRCCKVSEAGAWCLEPETKTSCHARLPQRLNPGKPQDADLCQHFPSSLSVTYAAAGLSVHLHCVIWSDCPSRPHPSQHPSGS